MPGISPNALRPSAWRACALIVVCWVAAAWAQEAPVPVETPVPPPESRSDEPGTAPIAPEVVSEPASPAGGISIEFDLDVPLELLRFIESGAATDEQLEAWARLPGNREIVRTGMPLARLVENARAVIERRASDYRQPLGQPGTVRMEPLESWRTALAWLEVNADSLARTASRHVSRYAPLGVEVPAIEVYFHLGGGWDAHTSDAVYVNLTSLLDYPVLQLDGVDALVAGEAMRRVARQVVPELFAFDTVEHALFSGVQLAATQGVSRYVERRLLRGVYPEGTFMHQRTRAFALADLQPAESMARLDRFVATAVAGRAADAESLFVAGLREGTFPALGALLARTIDAERGTPEIAACIEAGPVALFSRYASIQRHRPDLPALPMALESRLERLADEVQPLWVASAELQEEAYAALEAGDYARARVPLEKLIELVPDDPIHVYNLACVLAKTGEPELALARLEESVRLGFDDPAHMRNDPDLISLHELEGFQRLLDGLSGVDDGAAGP